jgi:4-aminobutyrate--pyruvate transaminase
MILAEGPDTVAAFIAEPVMVAGGVVVPPATYFPKVQEVLRRHDVLLIVDEIVCGFGRTGSMFGSETFDLKPDIATVAKALAAGYQPIGALLMTDPIYEALVKASDEIGVFSRGFSFSGHPVAAAVALRALELMESRDIVGHVGRVSLRFQQRLAALGDHPIVGVTRGVALLGGVELVADKVAHRLFDAANKASTYCVAQAQEQGLLVRPMVDGIAIVPPLVITEPEIDQLFDRLSRALDNTAAHFGVARA